MPAIFPQVRLGKWQHRSHRALYTPEFRTRTRLHREAKLTLCSTLKSTFLQHSSKKVEHLPKYVPLALMSGFVVDRAIKHLRVTCQSGNLRRPWRSKRRISM